MATSIELSHIRKAYGDTLVIPDLDLKLKKASSLLFSVHQDVARRHCFV